MKRLAVIGFLCMLIGLLSTHVLMAQSDEHTIAYGETVAGEITNRHFDVIYTFSGESGDIVIINLIRSESADYDPYLYLTTPENMILAQNDDTYSLDSRIIAELPDDGEYLIVATRRGERSGSGQGGYELNLDKGRLNNLDTTIEGRVDMGETPPTHIFVPEATGVFSIQYQHIRGAYFPGLTISMMTPDSSYEEDIAQIAGRGLKGGEVQIMLESDAIYILTLEQNSYDYTASEGDSALYTLAVAESE